MPMAWDARPPLLNVVSCSSLLAAVKKSFFASTSGLNCVLTSAYTFLSVGCN